MVLFAVVNEREMPDDDVTPSASVVNETSGAGVGAPDRAGADAEEEWMEIVVAEPVVVAGKAPLEVEADEAANIVVACGDVRGTSRDALVVKTVPAGAA